MRALRLILWIFCTLALLAIAAVLSLYLLITPERVEKQLQQTLSECGYSIRMNEAAEVRILPKLAIALPAAELFDQQNKLVAYYRSAYLTINPWWLLIGRVHLDLLDIDGFFYENRELMDLKTWLQTNRTDNTAFFDGIVIESLEFNNAEVRLGHNNREVTLSNLRAQIANPAPQMHAPIAFAGQLRMSPEDVLLETEAAFSLDLNLAAGQIALESFSMQAKGTQTALPVEMQISAPLIRLNNSEIYAKTAHLSLKGFKNLGTADISLAEGRLTAEQFKAPDLHLTHDNGVWIVDLRSPVNLSRATDLWQLDHLQGFIAANSNQEQIPVNGKVKVNRSTQQADLELYGRLNNAPMSFQGHLAGFDHPAIDGKVVIGRLTLSDLNTLASISSQSVESDVGQPSEKTAPEESSAQQTAESTKQALEAASTRQETSEQNADNTVQGPAKKSIAPPAHPLPGETTETAQEPPKPAEDKPDEAPAKLTSEPSQAPGEPTPDKSAGAENDNSALIAPAESSKAPPEYNPEASQTPSALPSNGLIKAQWVTTIATQTALSPTPEAASVDSASALRVPLTDFSFLNRFDYRGEIVVGELVAGKLKLVQFKSDVELKDGTLVVKNGKALAYEGKTSLQATLNAMGHWSMRCEVDNARLADLVKDAGGTLAMGGQLNLQSDLYGNGFSKQTLNGQIGFAVSDTKLFGANLAVAVSDIARFKEPQSGREFSTPVSELRGIVTIHDSQASLDQLTATIEGNRLRGTASINLYDETINGELNGRSAEHRIVLGLQNKWYEPMMALDAERIRSINGIVPPAPKKKDEEPSGWDRLKNFFKERF